jgi:hypothetical protein
VDVLGWEGSLWGRVGLAVGFEVHKEFFVCWFGESVTGGIICVTLL